VTHWDTEAAAGLSRARAACWGDDWGTYGLETVQRYMPPVGFVLDLGCGVGRIAIPLARANPHLTVIGADSCDGMLELAAAESVGVRVVWVGCQELILHSVPRLAGAYSLLAMQHMACEVAAGYVVAIANMLEPQSIFVFQIADSGHCTDISQGHTEADAIGWCDKAGLAVESVDGDLYSPTWRWIVARKP